MNNLTDRDVWDKNYVSQKNISEMKFDWRYRMNHLISEKIESVELVNKNVLEIGAGDSTWLPYLAKKFPSSRFSGIDYSESGCQRLAERSEKICGAGRVGVYCQDMFNAEGSLHSKFDMVMSFGVIEHFKDLSLALLAKKKFVARNGLMLSIIPNMSGSIGQLCNVFNDEVYKMHNPHDWTSFLEGHNKAGLVIVSGGYLGSTNFAMLSSCFSQQHGFAWQTYKFLSLLSLTIWSIEDRLGGLPTSKFFSPYIFAISKSK